MEHGNYFYDMAMVRGEGRAAGLPTFGVDTISFFDARKGFMFWSRGCRSLYELNKHKRSATFLLQTKGHRAEGCRIDELKQFNSNRGGKTVVNYMIIGSYKQLVPTDKRIYESSEPTKPKKLEPDFTIKLG
jgi:hypothetical protein